MYITSDSLLHPRYETLNLLYLGTLAKNIMALYLNMQRLCGYIFSDHFILEKGIEQHNKDSQWIESITCAHYFSHQVLYPVMFIS